MSVSKHDTDAARLLAVIGPLLDRLLLQEPEEGGRPLRYNPVDYALLNRIEQQPGCTGSDLARWLGIARTTVQSALDRLEKQALVEKRQATSQAKARHLHLTEHGVRMRALIRRHDLVNMAALLAPLDREEIDYMLPRLERVAAALVREA